MSKKDTTCINHYTSVVVNGNLAPWSGPNPDKYPESLEQAKEMARVYRSYGHSAYAVIVKEIPDPER